MIESTEPSQDSPAPTGSAPKRPNADEIEAVLSRGKRGRLALWLLAAVVIGGGIGAVLWWQWPREVELHYVTRSIDRGDIVLSASATGTLAPRRTVTIGAEISGRIATVEVENNERVARGQVLATFDTTVLEGSLALAKAGLASSQAALRRAEASYAEARGERARAEALAERGVVAEAEVEAARTQALRASADLDQARADLERARAQVAEVQTQLGQAAITSPIDGVILAREVEPGQTVASSLQAPELFVAAEDLARMRLEVWVDEADVGLVEAGQSATFEVSAWPGRTFEAEVESLDLQPTMTENVVTYVAVLSVDNADHLLRPGMTAQATIVTGVQEGVLRVPNAALRFSPPEREARNPSSALVPRMRGGRGRRGGGGTEGIGTVYVLRDGAPLPLRVETGRTDGQHTAITAGDLREGDEVIVRASEAPALEVAQPEGEGPPRGEREPRGGGPS